MWKVGIYGSLAKRAFRRGNHEAAIAHADEVLARRPCHGELLRIKGISHYSLGQWDKALACLRRAAEEGASGADFVLYMARAQVRVADDLEYKGQHGEAQRLYSESARCCQIGIAKSSRDGRFYSCRSLALIGLGHYEQALQDSQEAWRLDKNDRHARANAGRLKRVVEAQRTGHVIQRRWDSPGQMRLEKATSCEGLARMRSAHG